LKNSIAQLIARAVDGLPELADSPQAASVEVSVERTRDSKHGDFACNIAMRLAKSAGMNPRELAQTIIDRLPESTLVEKVAIAGPGFINIYVSKAAFHESTAGILERGDRYGQLPQKSEPRYLLEFVSANPTGPLQFRQVESIQPTTAICE